MQQRSREAEVDWGTAWVRMGGQDRRFKLFCMRSRYSGKPFVRAYPWERQEMFLDGKVNEKVASYARASTKTNDQRR